MFKAIDLPIEADKTEEYKAIKKYKLNKKKKTYTSCRYDIDGDLDPSI